MVIENEYLTLKKKAGPEFEMISTGNWFYLHQFKQSTASKDGATSRKVRICLHSDVMQGDTLGPRNGKLYSRTSLMDWKNGHSPSVG